MENIFEPLARHLRGISNTITDNIFVSDSNGIYDIGVPSGELVLAAGPEPAITFHADGTVTLSEGFKKAIKEAVEN